MTDLAIATTIEQTIRDRLKGHKIIRVETNRDADFNGMQILFITVVLDDQDTILDPKKTSGLIGYIRPKLAKLNEFAFPVIRFISQSEARELAA